MKVLNSYREGISDNASNRRKVGRNITYIKKRI